MPSKSNTTQPTPHPSPIESRTVSQVGVVRIPTAQRCHHGIDRGTGVLTGSRHGSSALQARSLMPTHLRTMHPFFFSLGPPEKHVAKCPQPLRVTCIGSGVNLRANSSKLAACHTEAMGCAGTRGVDQNFMITRYSITDGGVVYLVGLEKLVL
jgi:hypothetical protein